MKLDAVAGYAERFGRLPSVVVAAPGRVNLIGEHVDYCGGLVLPMAIDRHVVIAAAPGQETTVHSALTGDGVPLVDAVIAAMPFESPPVHMHVESDLPVGAGLSSSAALAVAAATAVQTLAAASLDPLEKSRLCRHAETAATGVPCGLMDQLASVFGRGGHALLIDCAVETVTPVAWPDPEVVVLVVDTGVRRALADGRYAARRRECEEAMRAGVSTPRTRHVSAEIARTRAAAEMLASGRWDDLGRILSAGHASLRDDYEVSCPELDTLVRMLDRPEVFGARMTGAGFGGCVIALVRAADAAGVADAVSTAYRDRCGRAAAWFTTTPSRGVAVVARGEAEVRQLARVARR